MPISGLNIQHKYCHGMLYDKNIALHCSRNYSWLLAWHSSFIMCPYLLFVHLLRDVYVVEFTKPSSSQMPSGAGAQKDDILSHLLDMGFDYQKSLEALQATDYNLSNASAMLAQQSMDYDLSSTPTKDPVRFSEGPAAEDEPDTKRKG